jgi:hypothetical protein
VERFNKFSKYGVAIFLGYLKIKASKAEKPWMRLSYFVLLARRFYYSHANCPAWPRLRFTLTLLAIAEAANKVEDKINSPDKNPSKPVTKMTPIVMS